VIEAKKEGATLSGVEVQSARYAQGLPAALPAWRRPLPFVFESTGVETRFTNGLDPQPRARPLFAFFRPELLVQWLTYLPVPAVSGSAASEPDQAPTCLARLQQRPTLITEWGQGGASFQLWPAQITAIRNLETSLAANKPRALIQMATGSGKTFTAISAIYRLIKFGGARRVLFLVDRGNLARQTKKEFDAYASPHNAYKFGEEFIVQHLQGNQLDGSARLAICTIQRMFSMLKGKELPEEADEESTEGAEALFKQTDPIGYNPAIPIESFDIVVTDEAHRSIYNLWRQVLEYFDAYLIGLTATPNKQTFGFFNQNLVMEYGHTQAVADGVNVNYDVYRIKTEVTEAGARVDKGYWLETQDKATRRKTAWQLDEDFEYEPAELDRAVQTPDQIRIAVRTLRDKWNVDLFPNRQELPKTLIDHYSVIARRPRPRCTTPTQPLSPSASSSPTATPTVCVSSSAPTGSARRWCFRALCCRKLSSGPSWRRPGCTSCWVHDLTARAKCSTWARVTRFAPGWRATTRRKIFGPAPSASPPPRRGSSTRPMCSSWKRA
jgi:type I restriction enzyme R subunit